MPIFFVPDHLVPRPAITAVRILTEGASRNAGSYVLLSRDAGTARLVPDDPGQSIVLRSGGTGAQAIPIRLAADAGIRLLTMTRTTPTR